MRIGVITDAHANLPALRAALAAMKADGCEQIFHTGDAIGIGPHPREVLTELHEQNEISLIMGNHDELFAWGIPEPVPAWMSTGELSHQHWTHEQLEPLWRGWIREWPYLLDREYGPISVRFQHYARNNNAFGPVSEKNQAAELDAAFQSTADIVFFGHHHPQADVRGLARYINPGALGCKTSLGARYALLEIDDAGNPTVLFRTVPYDDSQVYRDMVSRHVPEADFLMKTFLRQQ